MMSEGTRSNYPDITVLPFYRNLYNGNLISCGGYTKETAEKAIEEGHTDLVAFGKLFVSNPDLVKRYQTDGPLNESDKSTFYHGGEKGYIDYPFLKP